MTRNNVIDIVSEISLSGSSVCLGKCSSSTVSRYKKDVNNYLKRNGMNWSVVGSYDKSTKMGYLSLN